MIQRRRKTAARDPSPAADGGASGALPSASKQRGASPCLAVSVGASLLVSLLAFLLTWDHIIQHHSGDRPSLSKTRPDEDRAMLRTSAIDSGEGGSAKSIEGAGGGNLREEAMAVVAAGDEKMPNAVPVKVIDDGSLSTSRETRSFPPMCRWDCYLDRHPDLTKKIGRTEEAALGHYLKHGSKEGRICDCAHFSCCELLNFNNAGHTLTENVLDLHRCGSIVAFGKGNWLKQQPEASKFLQMARLFNSTVAETRGECVENYHSDPSSNPSSAEGRFAAYSLMSDSTVTHYDALYAARVLRDAQARMLLSCGMDPPKFNTINAKDGHAENVSTFEQLIDRPPSKRVIIVVRRPMRRLLNAQSILSLCQEMKLSCSLFDANGYFRQEESDDFCTVLEQFQDNPLVVGVQGAEMFYPLFLGLRLFLVTDRKFDPKRPLDARRIGNATGQGEYQAAVNLVRRSESGGQFDPYFPEFSMIFGSDLTPLRSEIDVESLEMWKNSTKRQCREGGNFCADLTADLEDVRMKLERLIKDGKLLLARQE